MVRLIQQQSLAVTHTNELSHVMKWVQVLGVSGPFPQRKAKLISAGIKLISILLLPLLAEGKLKTFQT